VRPARPLIAVAAAAALVVAPALPVTAAPATAAAAPLTDTAHLDFLLDRVTLHPVTGHSTYGADPVSLPWTYADRNDDGSFRRIGGGTLDPATNTWTQGAFNSDDVSRAAVVYLRQWRQTGDAAARQKAEAVLRGLAYFQTTSGADAGNVVLWMQPDGSLNRSAEPVELPDPSDSGPSYWLARTVWAYGEGYAAFVRADPAFAAFLRDRLRLAVRALDREVLDRYGDTVQADGVRVPAWLIVDEAGATAEAVLGLAAYTAAAPADRGPDRALARFADGIRRLAATTSDTGRWPYGAILPSAASRTSWHPWASQMSAALAAADHALGTRASRAAVLRDTTGVQPDLLAAGGPDNLWGPAPTDRTQIAYGVDSRVQDLLAARTAGGDALAAVQAAWYFGANRSGKAVYDPATGVTTDGVQPDGSVNRNGGAESTIHGLLTMLALDAHPAVARQAQRLGALGERDGLRVVEAETASTTGTVFTPDPASSAERAWSGGKGLTLRKGQRATLSIGAGGHVVEAVVLAPRKGSTATPTSRWTSAGGAVRLTSTVGAQGITAQPGALLPQPLGVVKGDRLTVTALSGTVRIDAVLVRPLVQTAVFGTGSSATRLVVNTLGREQTARSTPGATAQRFHADGRSAGAVRVPASGKVLLPAGGFALVR